MRSQDFKDFGSIARKGKYDRVPFTKVKSLFYKKVEPKILWYKTKFSEEWITQNVLEGSLSTRNKVKNNGRFEVPDPAIAKPVEGVSQAKKADIRSMLKFMLACDKEFMSLLV